MATTTHHRPERLVGEADAVLAELLRGVEPAERDDASERVLATILFTDIVGSTERLVELGDRAWGRLLLSHHAVVRTHLAQFRGQEVDTAGDGFFATFDAPARAVRCARAIADALADLGLPIRAGLHAGECEVLEGKVAGIAVHTGARVTRHAGPGEVLVSGTVRDLVAGSGLEFECRGAVRMRGLADDVRLFSLCS